MANIIAAEIHRRLMPELDIESQKEMIIKEQKGEYVSGQRKIYGKYNAYKIEIYKKDPSEITNEEKKEAIRNFSYNENFFKTTLFTGKLNFGDILPLLKDPDQLSVYMNKIESDFELNKYGKLTRSDLTQMQTEFARKLISTINFLEKVANNEEGKKILIDEFGLDEKIIDKINFVKIHNSVKDVFKNIEGIEDIDKKDAYTNAKDVFMINSLCQAKNNEIAAYKTRVTG